MSRVPSGYLSLHVSPTLTPTGGASEAPPQYPRGCEPAASNKSGPAGSVTGIVLAHFWRGGKGWGRYGGNRAGFPR